MAKSKTPDIADDMDVEFTHPDTGQTYGATFAAFTELYAPLGYELTRRGDGQSLEPQPEAPASEPAPVLPPADQPPAEGE